MMSAPRSLPSVLTLAVLVWPVSLWSIELYKYENEDGVVVLDSQIPARYVRSGYTVLSSDGRVLRVVERALSEEERKEKARLDKEEEKRLAQIALREERDATLMRLYSTPGDVIRARDTKIATIRSFIESAEGTLQRMINQRKQYEASAAEVERSGGTITRDNILTIQNVVARIQQTEIEISDKRQEIDDLTQSYDLDLLRVKELYGLD